MRLISLDTETTGSSPASGDRCVDIGLVEIIDGRPTGRSYQTYIDPDRPVHWRARQVHGLSNAFLSGKPSFREVAGDILDFIEGSPIIAHGAKFDRDMLLYDFHYAGLEAPEMRFFDTLPFMRSALPGLRRYSLDHVSEHLLPARAPRKLHGALEDAEILAECCGVIELRKPGATASWFRTPRCINPWPKSWERRVRIQEREAPAMENEGSSQEQTEADRIAAIVRNAVDNSRDFPDLVIRLRDAGICLRPIINRQRALHGVRFSTPNASITGGAIGVAGADLNRKGLGYVHSRDHALVQSLVREHDNVMGRIETVKHRFTAVPSRISAAGAVRAAAVKADGALEDTSGPKMEW